MPNAPARSDGSASGARTGAFRIIHQSEYSVVVQLGATYYHYQPAISYDARPDSLVQYWAGDQLVKNCDSAMVPYYVTTESGDWTDLENKHLEGHTWEQLCGNPLGVTMTLLL